MNIDFSDFDDIHIGRESLTHPIEPLATCPGVLPLLAGRSLRRRHADPVGLPGAHSGASNCASQVKNGNKLV